MNLSSFFMLLTPRNGGIFYNSKGQQMKTIIVILSLALGGCSATLKDVFTPDPTEINRLEDAFERFRLAAKTRLSQKKGAAREKLAAEIEATRLRLLNEILAARSK